METKEIAKLQQQFSDLKRWLLEEEAIAQSDRSSDENSNDSEPSDEEVQVSICFVISRRLKKILSFDLTT